MVLAYRFFPPQYRTGLRGMMFFRRHSFIFSATALISAGALSKAAWDLETVALIVHPLNSNFRTSVFASRASCVIMGWLKFANLLTAGFIPAMFAALRPGSAFGVETD